MFRPKPFNGVGFERSAADRLADLATASRTNGSKEDLFQNQNMGTSPFINISVSPTEAITPSSSSSLGRAPELQGQPNSSGEPTNMPAGADDRDRAIMLLQFEQSKMLQLIEDYKRNFILDSFEYKETTAVMQRHIQEGKMKINDIEAQIK